MTPSLVSIIVPCYNQGKYLSESLDSIAAQTYPHWECIIINDGSTDNTGEVAQLYLKKDNRFKYLEKKNRGLSAARNSGLAIASGSWIQFLDADDHLQPAKLQASLRLLETNTDAEIIVSNFKMFVTQIANTTPPFCVLKQDLLTFDNILFGWESNFTIPIHCGMFKSSLFEGVLFNETLKAKEDWVMWIDLFINKPKAIYLDQPLAYYRNNPDSMTKDLFFVLAANAGAYKHIITSLPESYSKKFACAIIDALHQTIIFDKKDLLKIQKTTLAKTDRKIKNLLHKLKPKKS